MPIYRGKLVNSRQEIYFNIQKEGLSAETSRKGEQFYT